MAEHTRREMLKLTAGAVIAIPLLREAVASAAEAPFFFTAEEFRLVDELAELILPADDHSPGAQAAEVAAYLDRRLAESFDAQPRQLWREGLKRIEALSAEMHGRPFLEAAPDQRVALLARIAQNEARATEPEEEFFREMKARTVHAYYTSKIGIHTEMEYKGNTYLKEFAGYAVK